MSLTDKAHEHIGALASKQQHLHDFIFADFDQCELLELTGKLKSLKERVERASMELSSGP
jgi:hypothetical protein